MAYPHDPERRRAYNREWARRNKDKVRASNQKWRSTQEGYAAYLASRRATRAAKRQRIAEIKLERGCADCGYNKHPAALHFDHISEDKVDGVGQLVRYSWEHIEAEIAKCEVVCANCHAIRSYDRNQHGRISTA